MLCCLGLFAGFALGSVLGGPWIFLAPAIGFGLGLIGDTKLMRGSHRSYGGFGMGCCGGGHMHNKKIEKDAKDTVCGMEVDEKTAEYTAEFRGKTYYFCSHRCMSTFKKDPRRYVKKMSLWKLRLTMLGTLAIIISTSTAFFAVLLQYLGSLNIISLAALVALFNIVQWLFAPHLINAIFRVKEVKPTEFPKLQAIIDQLSRKSGIKKPRLGVASIPIPNAFAYGSPISGNRVAVTQGLLDTLKEEEVEAVLGHELGHLKHRDVQVMMLVSFLPSLFYLIGRSMLYSAYFGGYYGRSRRAGGSGIAIIGMASIAMYFVLLLFTLGLSRLREYYADRHSASIVEDGPRKLSEGLAKIVSKTGRMKTRHQRGAFTFNSFKTLFISDPDRAERDVAKIAQYTLISSDHELVEHLLKRRITTADRIMEVLSTHPNITRRLRALKALESEKGGVLSG